jgi:hypothetical protein
MARHRSIYTRNMKILSQVCLATGALCLFGAGLLSAQADRGVRINRAVEVEFETERGRAYKVQSSADMVEWEEADDKIYGHGGRGTRLYSTSGEEGKGHKFFRIVEAEVPEEGLAPWSFAGLTLSLGGRPNGDFIQFQTETAGVRLGGGAPDPFAYTLTRTGADRVRLEIQRSGAPGRRDIYTFVFVSAGKGTWVRDEFRKSELKDRDVGAFSVVEGNIPGVENDPPGAPIIPIERPAMLSGKAFVFQSGSTPDRLEFATDTAGIQTGDDVDDGELNRFTYVYSAGEHPTASLTVNFKADRWDEYTLTFASANQGSFVRREFKKGQLDDIDSGAFSSTSLPAPAEPPAGGVVPGDSPAGLSFVMDDGGEIPTRIVFTSATAGTEFDDSEPSEFTYVYSVTGSGTATLVLTFKPGKWDEYSLTFNKDSHTGTFIRREFDKNSLKDSEIGSFAASGTSP